VRFFLRKTKPVLYAFALIFLMIPFNNCGKPMDALEEGDAGMSSTVGNGLDASVSGVNTSGLVSGWALDPADTDRKVAVAFYLDGPVGQGVKIGVTVATGFGIGGSKYIGHYFSFRIPAQYIDNNQHSIYAYAGTEDAAGLLPSTPKTYAAFAMTQDFQDYFTSDISPYFNNPTNMGGKGCNVSGCHAGQVSVDQFFIPLSTPSPFIGGTATNNALYLRMTGGMGHAGGSFCGDTSFCSDLRAWWALQFP
jgi:hypothetical protein